MEIRVSQPRSQVPITVVQLVGSLHLGNAEQLETTARTAIANGTHALVLDLTQVPTMTSAGLRVLHLLYRLLGDTSQHAATRTGTDDRPSPRGKSPHLKLVNPSPALGKVLTIAGFDTFLEIHDTIQGAVESLETG